MKTIVIGALCTDVIIEGAERFPAAGEHTYAKSLRMGAGGKAGNIATMITRLAPEHRVAMLGRTARDSHGLWKVPMDALAAAGVNTDYVKILSGDVPGMMPNIAVISVGRDGKSQVFSVPGVSDDFCPVDVDAAEGLFEAGDMLVLVLESPLATVEYATKVARRRGLKIVLDPGGVRAGESVAELLQAGVFLVKPNEHEAWMLTGIEVTDFASAGRAADKLRAMGAENVLITHGAKGAYLFTEDERVYIPVPDVVVGDEKDETGCGDQAMAALCAALQNGSSLADAARQAVAAGALQFYRAGVQPVEKEELARVVQ